MAVSAVSGTQSGTQTAQSAAADVLDKNAFLNLLITELRNQDPMNPMEDRDFIAQLA